MLSCLQLPEGFEHNTKLYRFFIGYRCHFQDTPKPAQTKHVKPIRKVIGFSRLACRERSERNAKREKTYIIFAGGTDAKILNPFPKEIPLILFYWRNGSKKSTIHFRRKYRLFLYAGGTDAYNH